MFFLSRLSHLLNVSNFQRRRKHSGGFLFQERRWEVKPATTPPVCEGTRTGGFVERDVSWIHTENGARAVEAILARLDACQSSWITWEYVSVALYDGVILRSVGSGYVLVSNRSVFFYGPFLVKSRMDRPGLPGEKVCKCCRS